MKTLLIILATIIGLMWYVSIGRLAYDYIGGEPLKLYAECRAEQRLQLVAGKPARSCDEGRFGLDEAGVVVSSLVWPVSVPVIYGIRNPIRIAIIIPSLSLILVGGIQLRAGINRYRGHRHLEAVRKHRDLEHRMRAGDEHLKREAPEFLESLVRSDLPVI